MRWIALNRFTLHYQRHQCFQLPLKQPTSFQRVTTPLSLRRGAGGEAVNRWNLSFISLPSSTNPTKEWTHSHLF